MILWEIFLVLLTVKSKRKRALLENNPSGINLTYTNCREKGLSFLTVLFYNLVAYA
jgi:hypothetical protein